MTVPSLWNRAGRSAMREHKRLSRVWRSRVFGRRTAIYVFLVWGVLVLVVSGLHIPSRWALLAGVLLGGGIVGCWAIPEAVMPGWIRNWQLGAWGEQQTAKQLRMLSRDWLVRHDLAAPSGGNRDHIVAGPSVFVLDSKNFHGSCVTIEGSGVRVARIDDPDRDGYLLDRFFVKHAAWSLAQSAETKLGFPIAVYPVLVVWAQFEPGAAWLGNMAIVRGDLIADWLQKRPADLLDQERRVLVASWVKSLPLA
jgi:hypothetical protein